MPCKDKYLFLKRYMTFFPPISHKCRDPRPLPSSCPGLGNKEKKNDESVLPKYDWRRENKKVSITICHCHDSKDPISTKDNTLCEVMWLASGIEMIVHTTVSLRYRPTETGSYSLLKGSSACVCKRKNPDSEDTLFYI